MIGQRVLHYEITDKIGEGGMGAVYLARDTRLDRPVALKFITAGGHDSATRERFLREARSASRLSHPNIVGIHAIESVDDTDFMVMEYVRGNSVDSIIEEDDVAIDQAIAIVSDTVEALKSAHESGIVHRDVKPANVIVAEDGRAKVLDFGIALIQGAEHLTRTDATLGTVGYMSPEQARGEQVDHRSDLFSVGAVLYELIASTPPFHGEYFAATVFKVLNEDPEPLSRFRANVPGELQRIVSKCLQKDRDLRYQSAADLLADLRNVSRRPDSTTVLVPPGDSAGRVSRRTMIGAAIGLAIVLAVALFYSLRPEADNSIAVLPFINSTGDPAVEFLCSGISEGLINRLTIVPDLKVISRASSFALGDLSEDLAEVGRQLDVKTVLLGHLDKRGDDLSISAELVDVGDNRQLWGQRYLRPVSEILSIEDEISTSIAQHLEVRLSSDIQQRISSSTTTSPEAYQLYLRGRFRIVGSRVEMDRALEYFEQATEIDPDFALAWAGMAHALAIQGYLATQTRGQLLDRARMALSRALELDPSSSEVQNAAGMIRFYFDWDWEGAEAAFKRSIERNAGNASAYNRYSTLLIALLRLDEALEMATKAAELDPISTGPTHDLGIAYFIRKEYDAASRQFDRAVEFHPSWPWGWVKGGLIAAMAGDTTRALSMAARTEEITTGWGSPLLQAWLSWVYAYADRSDLAQGVLDRMLEHLEHEYVDPYSMAVAYASVGDRQNTLVWVERAVEEKSPDAVFLLGTTQIFFRFIARESRYVKALERMAYPDAAGQRLQTSLNRERDST